MTVESLLQRGEENAISTAELVAMTGASSARVLQQQIERERSRGALILSASDGGYFLPDEGEKGRRELTAFVRTLSNRARRTYSAYPESGKQGTAANGRRTVGNNGGIF